MNVEDIAQHAMVVAYALQTTSCMVGAAALVWVACKVGYLRGPRGHRGLRGSDGAPGPVGATGAPPPFGHTETRYSSTSPAAEPLPPEHTHRS